ncbi:MAG: iron-containing alcohol dehydrogenase, partial [Nitrospina sp.]|nr:iron-containing alcohol dehydrogenase [Nitrospina sp.]
MTNTLDLEIKNSKNIPRYIFGEGSINNLKSLLLERNANRSSYAVYFVDIFFEKNVKPLESLPISNSDQVFYVDTQNEPTTSYVDNLKNRLMDINKSLPHTVIGIGGGGTLDVAKAISNLLTNSGNAEDYQGWDLIKFPGIYKIGIPTISGTGAEATRTCVMINPATGLKLGMNSDYTIFDQLILDPELLSTVPLDQYFYTGMDTFIHCVESLSGNYRNAIGDAFSNQAIQLCREVFLGDDMMSNKNRQKLMVASYLGGCAIGNSFVGVLHPFSAGLSVVLNIHHCLANCIAITAMGQFYPQAVEEFLRMAKKQ